jgi:hypothetical protein
MRAERPLVMVDIDGVLNPQKNQAERGFTPYRLTGEDDLLVWLHRDHGRMLNELDREGQVELRWGTTWNQAANRTVGPAIGLDREWDVLPIDRAMAGPVAFGTNWKAVSIQAGAEGRAFAWMDDFLTESDKHWAEDRVMDQGLPTLLLRIDPDVGMQAGHLQQIRDWSAGISGPEPITATQLLDRTPDLAADPHAREQAEWLARTVHALPASVPRGAGRLDRVELATSLWDRSAPAMAAERATGPDSLKPTDAFARQAVRRYLRGDGEAAMIWADRAALRAETPHAGHLREPGPHEHRLVLPDSPGREHALQVQALIDSAAAKIGNNPDWQRVHKSIQVGPDAPTILVNIRADRKNTAADLTVAFGNSGAVRQPYEELLRGGPDAILERIRTATDYELEPARLEAAGDRAGRSAEQRLSPLTDPAMTPPIHRPATQTPAVTAAGERPDGATRTGQKDTRTLG